MRTLIRVLALVALGVFAAVWLPNRPWLPPPAPTPPPQPVIQSQGPTIERLEQLSHLVATRVYIADVLVGEGNGCKGAWLIRGDALIAVDLSKASIVEKDEAAKKATIRLPPPEILQARVDHERTQIWELKSTTWMPWAADKDSLRDTVMAHAQRLVGHAAGSAENIQAAKIAAETVLRALYSEVGWQLTETWHSVDSSKAVAQ